jgi:hypothetical protein
MGMMFPHIAQRISSWKPGIRGERGPSVVFRAFCCFLSLAGGSSL